jgi:2-methylcitrate dehydratase PrpD
MNDLEITGQLAQFAAETKYRDIPKEVLEFTKALTLKTVAGMVVGANKPSGRKLAALIRGRKLPEEVGVLGSSFKTSLWEAIFLNAFFAHASELEDDRFYEGASWDITVIPVLVSLAENSGLSGKALLEALVVGLEVHARTCLFSVEPLGLVMVPGAVGPAVAAARALDLSTEETASAAGLAMSGVPLSSLNFGTDAHYFESALQSLQGLIAAEMAKQGMTSNPNIAAYMSNLLGRDRVAPERMTEDLGRRWRLGDTWIKKYPCCFATHRQIDALIELRNEHNLSYQELEAVEVHIGPSDEPCHRPEPKTEGDLQFSYQHVLACVMLDGDVNLEHFAESAISDPRLREARSKIKVIPHPDWSPCALVEPARLIARMKDGREYSRERKHAIGSPEEPLTMEQLRGLYAKFTRGILPEDHISRTAEALLNLENLGDVRELVDMLVFTEGT